MILKGELGKWQHSAITSQKNAVSLLLPWDGEGPVLAGGGSAAAPLGEAQSALLTPCESSDVKLLPLPGYLHNNHRSAAVG